MDLGELQNEIHNLDHDLAALNEVVIRLWKRKVAAEKLLQAVLDKGMSQAQLPGSVTLLAFFDQPPA